MPQHAAQHALASPCFAPLHVPLYLLELCQGSATRSRQSQRDCQKSKRKLFAAGTVAQGQDLSVAAGCISADASFCASSCAGACAACCPPACACAASPPCPPCRAGSCSGWPQSAALLPRPCQRPEAPLAQRPPRRRLAAAASAAPLPGEQPWLLRRCRCCCHRCCPRRCCWRGCRRAACPGCKCSPCCACPCLCSCCGCGWRWRSLFAASFRCARQQDPRTQPPAPAAANPPAADDRRCRARPVLYHAGAAPRPCQHPRLSAASRAAQTGSAVSAAAAPAPVRRWRVRCLSCAAAPPQRAPAGRLPPPPWTALHPGTAGHCCAGAAAAGQLPGRLQKAGWVGGWVSELVGGTIGRSRVKAHSTAEAWSRQPAPWRSSEGRWNVCRIRGGAAISTDALPLLALLPPPRQPDL